MAANEIRGYNSLSGEQANNGTGGTPALLSNDCYRRKEAQETQTTAGALDFLCELLCLFAAKELSAANNGTGGTPALLSNYGQPGGLPLPTALQNARRWLWW
jgi:hypothetical protein